MGIIFFEFDPSAFKSFLESKGFQPTVQHNELVYIRRHHKSPNVIVKIYTTISCNSSAVRSSGSDAIRIVAVFDNGVKSFGIGKFPKIYRKAPWHLTTEQKQAYLFDKVLVRLREAYDRCNQWLKTNSGT